MSISEVLEASKEVIYDNGVKRLFKASDLPEEQQEQMDLEARLEREHCRRIEDSIRHEEKDEVFKESEPGKGRIIWNIDDY